MPLSTLSHDYEKPSNPTYGDVFWPAMERNIQRMNDHTHDGDDGELIAKDTGSAASGSWGSDLGGGSYRQIITLPNNRQFDSTEIQFRLSTGEVIYPTVEKISGTTFYVYTNDNSKTFTILYV
jgi:hypothetical protein